MIYKVDPWNNFCRVFELPESYPRGFCFGGGLPVNFQMVDWFNPTQVSSAAVSKEVWEREVGPVEETIVEVEHDEIFEILVPFLQEKTYIKENRKYLVICNFGMSFVFTKESK